MNTKLPNIGRMQRSRLLIGAFFITAAVPIFCVFPYVRKINNPNEIVRVYMTMALVENRRLDVDSVVEIFGWVNDMARVPKSTAPNGYHRYSLKGPAVSLAGVPVYWAFSHLARAFGYDYPKPGSSAATKDRWLRATTWILRLFTVQLPCFLFLIWLERYLRHVSRDDRLRLVTVAAVGLGTNYLAYLHMFASHALFAVAAFSAFALAEREARLFLRRADRRAWVACLAGWFAGWATLLEYHALPVSFILGCFAVYVFWNRKLLAAWLGGVMFHVLLLMWFQWQAYGNPFTPGHKMVENPAFSHHNDGLFGILAPNLKVMFELSFDLGYGFFGTSPFMILGLLALPLLFYSQQESCPSARNSAQKPGQGLATLSWMVALLTLWLAISGYGFWRGGWTIGPRFFGCAPPFFGLAALAGLEWVARRGVVTRSVVQGCAAGLAIASIACIGLVAIVYNTLPAVVERPLTQFVAPMVRGGYFPYHLGHGFGCESSTPWYIAAIALFLTAMLPGFLPPWAASAGCWKRYLLRCALVLVFAGLGVLPGIATTPPEQDNTAAPFLRFLTSEWEPAEQDPPTIKVDRP